MDTTTMLPYLAGFFDGEGSIAVRRSGVRFSLSVQVTQLNPEPLILLQTQFGGRLFRKPDRRGFRSIVEWQIVAGRAESALKAMRPWMVVKADEADVAIEFQDRMRNPLPDRMAEIAERTILYERCRSLKQRSYDHIDLPDIPILKQDHRGARLPQIKKPKPPKKVRVKVAVPVRGDWQKGKKPDAATLAAEYHALGPAEVARRYGTSRQTVYNWLDGYQIPRLPREAGEQRRLAALKGVWRNPDGVH